MSSIDLERLIVRQKYFVPVKAPELLGRILEELRGTRESINGIHSWHIYEEHKNCCLYQFSMEYSFVYDETMAKEGTSEYKALVKRKFTEYNEGLPQSFFDQLRTIRYELPATVYVFVVNVEDKGCTCDTECSPTLYKKLSRRLLKEATEFEMQNAYLQCKRFAKSIFEGGLSATLIKEEKRESLTPTAQLLINDQADHHILNKIEELLDQATGEVLLCGWIGTLLLPKLKEIKQKGVNIRVITHKAKELKGQPGHQDVQRAFQDLISMIGKENISIRPECHCRVVVVDNKALIGSMDINAISLTGSHREIAIYTEDTEIVRNLRKYFNEIFSPLKK